MEHSDELFLEAGPVYAGRKDEARAQYQKASTMDLTAADKAELARQTRG